jgi:hypothetical protein
MSSKNIRAVRSSNQRTGIEPRRLKMDFTNNSLYFLEINPQSIWHDLFIHEPLDSIKHNPQSFFLRNFTYEPQKV